MCSLYDKILANRLKLWMNIPAEQSAYQRGKRAITQIFTLRLILEVCRKMTTKMYIGFLDLTKAFDKVNRVKMPKCLIKNGIGNRTLQPLVKMCSHTNLL